MATKTISLSEDAYERLRAMKREGESFSDVVRRLTAGVRLSEFHGVLSEGTAEELAERVRAGRKERNARREDRVDRLRAELDES